MKSKFIKIGLSLTLILTLTILTFYTIKNTVNAVDGETDTADPGTLAEGELDPETYDYYIDLDQFEGLHHTSRYPRLPTYGDYQIYCLEPAADIRYYAYDDEDVISYEYAKSLENRTYRSDCLTSNGHAATPDIGKHTRAIFTAVGSDKLPVAVSYILSGGKPTIVDPDTGEEIFVDPIRKWSIAKQLAIWDLRDVELSNGNRGDENLIIGDGDYEHLEDMKYDSSYDNDFYYKNEYVKEAKDYAEYDNLVRDKGLQPIDTTELDSVYTKVNQNTGEYTVGPFNVEYTNGVYGDIAFAGISEMTIIGYNSEKVQVRDDIEVEKIILKDTTTGIYGNAVTPEYFEPSEDLKVDETAQVYPSSGQDFQIVFEDPNTGLSDDDANRVVYISVKIKFKYMLANGEYTKMRGAVYFVRYTHDHSYNIHYHDGVEDSGCITTCYLDDSTKKQQYLMTADAIRSIYEQEIIIGLDGDEPGIPEIELSMDLGGHVWEDTLAGKESEADGVSNTTGDNADTPLKNVKVTLYTEDGEIAKLLSNPNEAGISEEELMHRINPTFTNDNGNYLFRGLNPMKKYYVVFEYNGQRYLPTEYLNTANGQYNSVNEIVNAGLYNTTEWTVNSKGTESGNSTFNGIDISRQQFDERFQEIGSYPENYPSSNSLGIVGNYNAVYTQLDLMGYTLGEDGTYSQTGVQLVDGFAYNSRGLEAGEYSEGVISTRIREYIVNNHEFPDEEAMRGIYQNIAGNDEELWRKLQFIEDCYIQAYTGSPFNQQIDLYPVYDQFVVNGSGDYATAEEAQNRNYDTSAIVLNGVRYEPIYPGQFFVNLGLWRRQEFDASLRKDVYKATLKINDKTVVYKYDKRNANSNDGTNNSNGEDNNTYWDINVRMSDYDSYYGMNYNREIYETDYLFNTAGGIAENHPGNPLEIYITYKITVRNQSMSIMGQINEVVDYYDKDYTYREDLSWVTYDNNNVSDDEYYNAMVNENIGLIANAKNINSSDRSRYGTSTESDIAGNLYNAVYIRGLENKKLATGESAYIYLTFQVNKENNRVILDGGEYATSDTPKENLAEINGYATYYRDGTTLPNGVTKNSSNIAGLLDRDSNPGNLEAQDLQGNRYERNFEDDTDKAPSLRVIVDEGAVREANGVVWEDERTETVGNTANSSDAIIGDGIRQDDEIGVEGVTVELIEKCIDGTERVWYRTTTGENGNYNFASFIPGNYIIRFQYGDTEATALAGVNGGANVVSYNGQDFKSTTYQDGIQQNSTTDISGTYSGYIDTATQNETGTYGYDIYAADSNSTNYSDAKDIWSRRQEVINYSDDNITNHIAEVLASPYSGNSSLYSELIENTRMTAETGVIVAEIEYDRQQTDGLNSTQNNSTNSSGDYIGDNQYNSNYTFNNIDLGLTERPKAQLEIDKSVANVKVTLANNSILFDINEAANNAIWQDHEEYSIDEEKLNSNDRGIDFENGEIGMYEEYYYKTGENNRDNRHRYSYRDEIDQIVRRTDKGLIQLTMDEELMHGATIQVTYAIKITNVGEVDYVDGDSKNFYYKGDTTGASIVTTTANQVVDYVANNLQFDSNNTTNSEDGWAVITDDNLINSGLVNSSLTEQLTNFNTIIQTEDFGNGDEAGEALAPGQEISKTLILSQLITPENTDDDLTYTNMAEIVKTSNSVGRRMAYSLVGNQDPTLSDASEVDSSAAERIVILPPFGIGEIITYCVIAVVVGAILVIGIVLIRRKVLKGKNK